MIPGMNAVGMKTAERTRAIPTTGPESLVHCFERGIFGRQALFDMALHALHHHDRVVYDQANREDQAE